jgi:Ferritin-like domain
MNRRAFLRGTAVTVPVVFRLQAVGGADAHAQGTDFRDDADVLNYALVLEYFLSQFYRDGAQVLRGRESDLISAIGADEDAHIAAITQTIQNLGEQPVAAPAIDYGGALDDRSSILHTALRFENLFAGAYLGAAGSIGSEDILQAAAGIFGAEERHAAIVGNLLGLAPEGGVYVGAVDRPASRAHVMEQVAPFLAGSRSAAGEAAVTL